MPGVAGGSRKEPPLRHTSLTARTHDERRFTSTATPSQQLSALVPVGCNLLRNFTNVSHHCNCSQQRDSTLPVLGGAATPEAAGRDMQTRFR